ncbi:hypothetical protein MXEN_01035 [Mycobacterium xenopi RIVM700367]|uniref:alpha/beta hydrolase n=1 Tax=Mycobacterium xenopi TaxID=1789 RepID=UPI00025ACEAB|nr:alpha/beta hydrolase [Mycobacterium xenopi]EID17584.1 hypothetical protein MXEN_01035 [Mycobacterium xenopi RIVM700367]
MPGVSEGWPTLSELKASTFDHLGQFADFCDRISGKGEKALEQIARDVRRPGGVEWEGAAADAAVTQAEMDVVKARPFLWSLPDAAAIARRGKDTLEAAKRLAVDAVDDAERDGFTVGEDYSVRDTLQATTREELAQRQGEAEAHASFIRHRVGNLVANDQSVTTQLKETTAHWGKLTFPESGGVQAVDFKQGGGPGDLPPDDPKKFREWWESLSPEQKDLVYSRDHDIGNHPGMPWDPPDHLGKDHYNRLHLPELEQKTQADIDRMQHSLDEMMRGHNVDDGALYALQTQLAAAKNHLQGYRAIEAELNSTNGPKRYLGQLDEFGHAAVAINNPDTATHNAILVPGTGQDLTTIGGADAKSLAMYNAALQADQSLRPQDVAVTTWMGYDRPMGVDHAEFPNLARAGAGSLDAFEAGQRASHVGAPSIDTVIGHSYGSTVVGAAASGGHHLDANNVIAAGSPGMLVNHASDLSLDPGAHVYATRAQNDIIGAAGTATQWTLGPEPDKPDFGAIRLEAAPGPAGPLGTPSVDAHSSYWNPGNKALLNMGTIIAGKPPPYVIGNR